MNVEMKKRIEELISEALEYDVLIEDEDSGGIIFEDELIGKNNLELLNLLMADRDLLVRIGQALRDIKSEEEELDDEYEESESEDDDN